MLAKHHTRNLQLKAHAVMGSATVTDWCPTQLSKRSFPQHLMETDKALNMRWSLGSPAEEGEEG